MKNEILNLTYASSLTELCEINSSFDSGILRIAYAGDNRNGSSISKDVFEKCLKTIHNCPIVCNYDRDSDTLGGHDMEIVRTSDGGLRLINVTQPVGVIPQNAKIYWESIEEDDGTIHDYLCAEALLWKRQEAFKKIKEDGITAQSMELTIKDGESINGIYHIYDFEFTAFALIGCEPCFESASLVFSKQEFKQQFSEMMLELKECYKTVATHDEVNNTKQMKYQTEGGKQELDKLELLAKYGIDVETLDFPIDDFTIEELTEKFEALKNAQHQTPETINDKFALTSNIVEEVSRVLESVKVQREWGECTRYWYVDCDFEMNEVYCWDTNDWLLYGFKYKFNGDNIEIDFESQKRKKYVIADFDEGEQVSPFVQIFEVMEQKLHEGAEVAEKYQAANDTITSMEKELGELRQYKADAENVIAKEKRDEVFSLFEDLVGIEAFEELKEHCMEYELETIEEKCFAIRGRNGSVAKFSMETKVPKLKIEKENKSKEPYGGLFEKYGISIED